MQYHRCKDGKEYDLRQRLIVVSHDVKSLCGDYDSNY